MTTIQLRNLYKTLIIVIFTVAVIYYAFIDLDQLTIIFDLSFNYTFLLTFLVVCSVFARGLINTQFYRNLNVPLSLMEGIGIAVLNTIGNLLPLSGGFFAKGLYLKKRYKLQFSYYLPATLSLFACFVSVNGITSLISLFLLYILYDVKISVYLLLGFSFMSFSIALQWLPLKYKNLSQRVRTVIDNIQNGWSILREKKKVLLRIIGIQIIFLLLISFRLWIIFEIFSYEINFLICLIFAGASVLTSFVNILPGGLGVREGIIGGISYLLGNSFGLSALVVAFDRCFAIVITLILFFCCSFVLSRPAENKLNL